MDNNYDKWERLVAAVARRERDRRIALSHSRDPSSISSSLSSLDFSLSSASQFDQDQLLVLRGTNSKLVLPPDKQEFVWTTLGLMYFRDETACKNCFLLGVAYLKIKAFGIDKKLRRFHIKSRFREVVEVIYNRMIHIKGAIPTKMMSPETSYSAYLVFETIEKQSKPDRAYSSIIFSGQPENGSRTQSKLVYFEEGEDREDDWKEIHLGDFYVDKDIGEVQVKLVDIDVPWKSGLIIEGIEFRPQE